jgi:hypothetical protein
MCNPAMGETEAEVLGVWGQSRKNKQDPILKTKYKQRIGRAQVIECLTSMQEAQYQ